MADISLMQTLRIMVEAAFAYGGAHPVFFTFAFALVVSLGAGAALAAWDLLWPPCQQVRVWPDPPTVDDEARRRELSACLHTYYPRHFAPEAEPTAFDQIRRG